MKVLILVQSIDLKSKPEYTSLRKAQEDTWDSIPHPNVDVIYYMPGMVPDMLQGNVLHIACDTGWQFMFFNLAKAMRHMLKHDQSWDYIFKTDNSTYIDKAKLHEILLTKPRERYYGGMIYPFMAPTQTQQFMWGDGYALSRDMVGHIVHKYNAAPLKGKQEDDIVVAQLMQGVADWDPSLKIDIPMLNNNQIELGHHAYRCRIDHIGHSPAAVHYPNLNEIINNDISMMNKIHNLITNGKTDSSGLIQEQAQNQA